MAKKASTAFKYIDDDLQNLKHLLTFRLDDVIPKESPHPSHPLVESMPIGTPPNHNSSSVVDGLRSSDGSQGESSRSMLSFVANDNKPPFHYSELIEFALKEKGELSVSEIYDWISQSFSYFRTVDESKWKPAVRHTLTTNPCFYKARKATRGYLWAFQSADEHSEDLRVLKQLQQYPKNSHHWKKRMMRSSSSNSPTHTKTSASTDGYDCTPLGYHMPESGGSEKPRRAVLLQNKTKTTRKRKHSVLIPAIPLLDHAQGLIVVESSDNESDNETEDYVVTGACTSKDECKCHVDYFIPRVPSDPSLPQNSSGAGSNTESNYRPSMPCCVQGEQEEHCCKQDNSNKFDCFRRNTGTTKENSMPSKHNSGTVKKNKTERKSSHKLMVSPPSVKESKSGHVLHVPFTMPIYKKKTALCKNNGTAPLHKVPKEVAVRESGLLEAPGVMNSRVTALPSETNLFSSKSATPSLEDIFVLDELTTSTTGNSTTAVSSLGPALLFS